MNTNNTRSIAAKVRSAVVTVLAAPFKPLMQRFKAYVESQIDPSAIAAHISLVDIVEHLDDITPAAIAEEFDVYDIAGNIEVDPSDVAEHVEMDASEVAEHVEVDPSEVAEHVEIDLHELAEQIGAENVAEHIEVDTSEVAEHVEVDTYAVAEHVNEMMDYEAIIESVHDAMDYEAIADLVAVKIHDDVIERIVGADSLDVDKIAELATSKVVESINGMSITIS